MPLLDKHCLRALGLVKPSCRFEDEDNPRCCNRAPRQTFDRPPLLLDAPPLAFDAACQRASIRRSSYHCDIPSQYQATHRECANA
ncbi:Uncharacterised protein [Vibrio cholerae]|nr:Uncharacterised protein [Vibrio cholerae]